MADSKNNTREDVASEYTRILFHNEFRMSGFLLKRIRFLKILMKAWRMDNSALEEQHAEKRQIKGDQK